MKFSRASERQAVDDSIYWGAHNKACALKEAGEDIILFSIGDPDLPTLDFIVDHAVSSLKSGRTHYSPGAGEVRLRQAIADLECGASGKATNLAIPWNGLPIFGFGSDADGEAYVLTSSPTGQGVFRVAPATKAASR